MIDSFVDSFKFGKLVSYQFNLLPNVYRAITVDTVVAVVYITPLYAKICHS